MSRSRTRLILIGLCLALGGAYWIMRGHNTVVESEGELASANDSADEVATHTKRPRKRQVAPLRVVSAAGREVPEAAKGRFEGMVLNSESGEAVPAAELVFSHAGAAETVVAGADGRFEFTPSSLGDYQLATARAEEFLPYAPSWEQSPITLVARSQMAVDGIIIYLSPAISYVGTVVDGAGDPVAGANVEVLHSQDSSPPSIVSDTNGEFTFQARNRSMLRAEFEDLVGYARVNQAVQASLRVRIVVGTGHQLRGPHGTENDKPRGGTASIEGRVLTQDGEPIAAFNIQVLKRGGMIETSVAEKAVFDGSGGFRVGDLAPGPYRVVVASAGYSTTTSEAVAAEGGGPTVTLRLANGAVVNGVVVDAVSEEPIERAKVSIESRFGGGSSVRPMVSSVVTNANGEFRITGLQAGRRSIVADALGYHSQIVPGLEIEDEGTVGPLEISLSPVGIGERPGLELAGIGAMLGAQEDQLLVRGVIAGGGAEAAGLLAGDVILEIDGRQVAELGFDDSIQAIRGPVGSQVSLRLQRGDQQLDVVARRGSIRS